MKTLYKILLLIICLLPLVACNEKTPIVEEAKKVESIEVSGDGYSNGILEMHPSEVVRLTATVTPSDTGDKVVWKSNDATIAPVNSGGVVTALKEGETIITVSCGDVSKEIKVVITKVVEATKIEFDAEKIEMLPNSSRQLSCTITPYNATNTSVVFSVEPIVDGVDVSETGMLSVGNVPNGTEFEIKAQLGDLSDTIAVLVSTGVSDIKVYDYDLKTEVSSLEVPLDEPYRVLHLMSVPSGKKLDGIVWSSSNESVCKVDNGRLTFNSIGDAVITVTYADITKEINVKVIDSSNSFIEEYHIPQTYINVMKTLTVPSTNGWQSLINFRSGGTGAANSEYFVYEMYKYGTSPDSYFANGGNCVDMGGLDINGLADDHIDGGLANMYLWSKIALGENSQEIRIQLSFHSKGTSKYKLRFTAIDIETKEVIHLTDWMVGGKIGDDVVYGDEITVTAPIHKKVRGKTAIVMIEYDDIDNATDNIENGLDAIRLKSIDLLNNDGTPVENPLWVIGDSNQSTEFTGNMIANIAKQTGMTLFRDTISGSTTAPASSVGLVDHIDTGYYENYFDVFGEPEIILICRGHNDLYWSSQPGNSLKLGAVNSTNKYETYGATRYTLDYFTNKYPNAIIIWTNVYYTATVDPNVRSSYNQNLATICAEYENVIYYDLYTNLGITSENYQNLTIADGIHYNVTTQKKFTSLMVELINGILNNKGE